MDRLQHYSTPAPVLAALHGVARAPALQVDHHLALVLARVVVVVGLGAVIAPAGGSSGGTATV